MVLTEKLSERERSSKMLKGLKTFKIKKKEKRNEKVQKHRKKILWEKIIEKVQSSWLTWRKRERDGKHQREKKNLGKEKKARNSRA